MSDEHASAAEGMDCMACMDDIGADNYVEYRSDGECSAGCCSLCLGKLFECLCNLQSLTKPGCPLVGRCPDRQVVALSLLLDLHRVPAADTVEEVH